MEKRPVRTAVLIATAKGIAADAVAQLLVEGRRVSLPAGGPSTGGRFAACDDGGSVLTSRETAAAEESPKEYDFRRMAAFGIFSGAYCGAFFYWQFSILFPRLFPAGSVPGQRAPWRVILCQVALDNGFFSPFVYCPTFYMTKGAICNCEWPLASLERYVDDFREVVGTLISIWVPAGLVNFTLMPVWFRAPFNSAVSLVYLTVLSIQAQQIDGRKRPPQCEAGAT